MTRGNFFALQVFDALRPTKIAAGETWTKTSQDGLLSDAVGFVCCVFRR